MLNKKLLILSTTLLITTLYATPCENPEVAKNDLNEQFKYGCFCGKEYPLIEHPSHKNYKKLNEIQRQELIDEYQKIDPYDDIDKLCKEHDICYIQQAKEAKVCNEKFIKELDKVEDRFSKNSEQNITQQQCKNLAYDIRSVFNTIFAPADDEDTPFDFGMLLFNGAITASTKVVEESIDTINDDNISHYPKVNERCFAK
jgi:hypothetical protein